MASTAPPPSASNSATATASASAPVAQPAVDSHSNRVDVINSAGGRILCVSDIRGEFLQCFLLCYGSLAPSQWAQLEGKREGTVLLWNRLD
jgi:hypothetical protein